MTLQEKVAALDPDAIALTLVEDLLSFDSGYWRSQPATRRKAAMQARLSHQLLALKLYLLRPEERTVVHYVPLATA